MRLLLTLIIAILLLPIACSQQEENISETPAIGKKGVYHRPPVDRKLSPNAIEVKKGPRRFDRVATNDIGVFDSVFNDSNYRQYAYAEKLGIDPLNSLSDAYNTKRPLVRIGTNEFYYLQELTHSMPYLVPEAAWLLEDIGAAFIDTLRNRGADGYKIIVTSVLRSPMQVKKLMRVNRNATDSSTHKFGTTFDIAYNNFSCEDNERTLNSTDLKQVLGEVLLDMRKQGRCMVKYEKKSPCFHITVTK